MNEQTSETIALMLNTSRVTLHSGPSTVEVPFTNSPAAQTVLSQIAGFSQVPKLSLRMLHIRGFDVFPLINVYLNAEKNPFDEALLIGSLALYGIRGSSTADSKSSGAGLNESWDVTGVFKTAIQQKNWSYRSFTLTFVPQHPFPEHAELSFERIELVVFS